MRSCGRLTKIGGSTEASLGDSSASRGAEPAEAALVRFGDFALDLARRELRHAGEVRKLQPKVFDLLALLVRSRDRVLAKDEILATLWPDENVTESSLTFSIAAIRRALGDDGERQAFVRTVHRHGYRFVAECHGAPSAMPTPATADPWETLLGLRPRSRLAGRASEMGEIWRAFDDARNGHTRFLSLVGEAGIGKTRLAAELAARAAADGALVLVARCEEDGAPAFWPWAQLLRGFVAGHSATEIRVAMGAGAADLAEIEPTIGRRLPDFSASSAVDPEHGRLRIFSSFVEFLRAAAAARPTVLVIDDLHWADASSLLLLRTVIAEIGDAPLLLLVTYRPDDLGGDHPLTRLAARLRREERGRRIAVGGLVAEETAELVRSLAGSPSTVGFIDAVHRITEGNPFFVEEVTRHLAEAGSEPASEGEIRAVFARAGIPAGVRETVSLRLGRLDTRCRAALAAAAAVGREFPLSLVEGIVDLPPGDLLRVLEPAEAAGLVVSGTRDRGRYRFAHALVRETIYVDVGEVRRAALHRRIAETLEGLAAEGHEVSADVLAHHFAVAAGEAGDDKAIAASIRAGIASLERSAFTEASLHFEHALGWVEARKPVDEVRRYQILMRLGESRYRAGRGPRSREAFMAAAESARSRGDALGLARAAERISCGPVTDAETIALLEEGLSVCPESEAALSAELSSNLAAALYSVPGTAKRREALCERALEAGRRSRDPAALLRVLGNWQSALWRPEATRVRLERADEQLGVAVATGRPRTWALAWRIIALAELGRLADCDAAIADFEHEAERSRWPMFLAQGAGFRAMRALADGRIAEAEEQAERSFQLSRQVDEISAFMSYWGTIFYVRREQGRVAEIEPAIRAYVTSTTISHLSWKWVHALLASEVGLVEEARAVFAEMAAAGFADAPPSDSHGARLVALQTLAMICARLGDREAAAKLHPLLLPYADRFASMGFATVCLGSVAHGLALLEATLGRSGEADRHFAAALAAHRQPGARLLHARTALDRAIHLGRASTGRETAIELLDGAAAVAASLALPVLAREVDEARRALG